jgi:antitoxin component of MazEF toxin-antitoxin module
MLAKLTSKNQITLPKSVMDQITVAEYFEVQAVNDSIMLTPVRMQPIAKGGTAADAVRQKLKELGITEQDITDAVQWARAQPTP